MNQDHSDLLDRARGLATMRSMMERETESLLQEALAARIDVSALSRALGVHRATIYRRAAVPSAASPPLPFS